MKKWIYISLSVLMAVIIGVFAFSARVGATVYYNVEAIPRAYFYQSDVSSFLIQSTTETYEEIYVNFKISYDAGDERTGTVLYCVYKWSPSGILQYVKLSLNNTGTQVVDYWESNSDSMGRLFYNGNNLTTAAGYMQDNTLFLSIDDENARQNRLFYFFTFPGVHYQDGYDAGTTAGYQDGYTNGTTNGINTVVNNPNAYDLYSQAQADDYYESGYQEGYGEGVNRGRWLVQFDPNAYGLYTQEQYDAQYQAGMNAVNMTSWLTSLLTGIAGFLNIKIGPVSIGSILLIPLSLSLVLVVLRIFRGGGSS